MAGKISRTRLTVVVASGLIAAALITLAPAEFDPGSRASAGSAGLTLDQIGTFQAPVHIDNAPGKKRLLFVVEQPGTIRVLRNGRKLGRPFLNISDRVQYGGEEGLLSVAFHPKFKKNRRFFVYYTNRDGNIEVDGFKARKKKPLKAKSKSRRKVIEIPHPASNHNGGQLQFGPDKLLYMATGDGGGQGDPGNNAQNRNSLLGKLLRIKPKRKRGYSTPNSNPFVGEAGRDEIYALGFRNPFRFSFDSRTDQLLVGDVGGGQEEEIDRATLAAAKGANFGWDCEEGSEPGPNPSPACPGSGFTDPIHTYPTHDFQSSCAVIGGYVIRDSSLGSQVGRYLYSDNCGGFVRSLDPYAANPSSTDADTGLDVPGASSFGEGRKGKLYITSLAGPVYRIK
jgi:glucose/arabinose dehydrogenase